MPTMSSLKQSLSSLSLTARTSSPRGRWIARHWRMPTIWLTDTEPNERFTMYSRGNVGEVFPHVMTALTGTLIGDAVRQGQIDLFVEMGVLRPNEVVGPSVGTGVFGGYLYMSGSAMRLFGVRMPGMTPADVDEQVMGEAPAFPPYKRAKGDRNLVATLVLSSTSSADAQTRSGRARRGTDRGAGRGWRRCPT